MNQAPTIPASKRRLLVLQVCSALAASGLWAQSQPPEKSEAPERKPEDILTLSPFTVDTTKDKGYFAENTLAGSRMNTNIADLGASISVINKQLLEDTASVDVNDIFRYEINTEGSSTYTPAVSSFRNDGPLDVIAGGTQGNQVASFTNATANRVRGIGAPSFATNNYPAISAVPVDSYNIQQIEISRGPNSMLFGMGSPAGIVNQNTAQAVLNHDNGKLQFRWDDRGSTRGSFSFNKGIIDDKLAIYGATLWDERRFERKPSYDNTRRLYGALTYKPFSKTVIRASVEDYTNHNRRPNSITPRDFISEWRAAGQPTYDSTTNMVTYQATGQQVGPYIINSSHPQAQQVRDYILGLPNYNPSLRGGAPKNTALSDANFTTYNNVSIFGTSAMSNTGSALFVPTLSMVNTGRPTMQISDGQLYNYFWPTYGVRPVSGWGTATDPRGRSPQFPASEGVIWANPEWSDVYNRGFLSAGGRPVVSVPGIPGTIYSNISNYRYAGVTDKSVYDWETINVNQVNFGNDSNATYNVELEQEILHNLHLSGGWFRQQFESSTNYTIAQLNATALFIDPNKYLPDGSLNPFFGKPYVEDFDPDQYKHSQDNDSYRAMLAYTPDFTQHDNWLKWLGRHQILGLWSKDKSDMVNTRLRPARIAADSLTGAYRFLNNQNENADGSPSGWAYQQGGVLRRAYYLANPNDPFNSNVTKSSGEWNHLTHTGDIRAYNYETSQFEDYGVTTAFNVWDSPSRNQREVESISAGITSYLWNERLVTTFGVRRDDYKARVNTTGVYVDADGVSHPALTNEEKFSNGLLNQDVVLNRWNIWDELRGTTRTAGGVLRPFRNWNAIDRRAESGSLWWQFVRDFGFSYNQSDNFNPPPGAQVDFFGNFLPKPAGEGKDYGVQFALGSKLFARITWFENTNLNERFNPGAGRDRITSSVDEGQFRDWAWTIARINDGDDPTDESSWDVPIPVGSEKDQRLRAAAEKIWQLPYTYYGSLPGQIWATRDAEAKGIEAQLNYNPTPNWTIRGTFGKQDTVYTNVLKEIDAWLAVRMPIWTSAKASDYLLPQYQNFATYVTNGGDGRRVDLTNFWSSYGYNSTVRDDNANGWTNQENYYNLIAAPQIALQRDLQGQKAPGQRRYRGSLMTNYRFTTGSLKGFEIGGAERWEDKMVIGYYGRASGADQTNPTRLDSSDISRPIYDSANFYTDVWIGYTRKILEDKVRMRLQLNVANVFEDGDLRPIAVDYEGRANAFRIIDSRQYTLTATFEF